MKEVSPALRCLLALGRRTTERDCFVPFQPIADDTNFDKAAVRRHIRRWRRSGHADFSRGLFSEDGYVAGAGYSITVIGEQLLREIFGDDWRSADQSAWESEHE